MHRLISAEASCDDTGHLDMADPASPSQIVVSLAAVTWDFRLVGRTRMLTEAWLRLGQPTIFVQIPSLRTALERITAPLAGRDGAPVVRPWPTYPSRWWSKLGASRLAQAIRRRAAALRRELDKLLSWDQSVALVVSPLWAPWLEELPFRHVVYDCIDELTVHVHRPELTPLFQDWEDHLLARASAAVVTAERLGEGLRVRRPDLPIALIRNGVDVERFQHLAAETPRPKDVPSGGRPVVGFVGALYEWIDWELIRDTARQLTDFEFVFVGPENGRSERELIASLPNVRLLGPRPYRRVPAYVSSFDVCWVPFKQDHVGKAANPVKIYEYLALGKPVVTTPVADTDSFGGLVQVAYTPAEMVARLRDAVLVPASAATACVEYARHNAWELRAREYLHFLASLDGQTGKKGISSIISPASHCQREK